MIKFIKAIIQYLTYPENEFLNPNLQITALNTAIRATSDFGCTQKMKSNNRQQSVKLSEKSKQDNITESETPTDTAKSQGEVVLLPGLSKDIHQAK